MSMYRNSHFIDNLVLNFDKRTMPSRKTSRNGFDYAASHQQTPGSYIDPRYRGGGGVGGYATVGYGGYPAYPYTQPYYPGYPTHPAYGGAYVSGCVVRIL